MPLYKETKQKLTIMKRIINRSFIAFVGLSMLVSCGNRVAEKGAAESIEAPILALEDLTTQSSEVALNDFMMMDESVAKVKQEAAAPSMEKSKELTNFIPTQAAAILNDDGVHKFIRTARMKFKVKNIPVSTYNIENTILHNNGFIIRSEIKNEEYYETRVAISKDSVLSTYRSIPHATMILRVPCEKLDTTLRQIAPLAISIDYRIVEAEDVTKKLMADRLSKERLAKKQQRMGNAINARSGRLGDAMSAEETLDYAQQQADDVKLSTYTITDQINYSTIYIDLYQEAFLYNELSAKDNEIKEYTPSFQSQALDALGSGWQALNVLFIFLLNIWPLLVVLCAGVVLFVKLKNKRNKQ